MTLRSNFIITCKKWIRTAYFDEHMNFTTYSVWKDCKSQNNKTIVVFFLIRKGFINVCVHSNSCNRSRNFIFLIKTAKNPSQGISFHFQTLVFAWHFRQSYRNLQWPCLGKRPRNPSLRLAETDNLFPKWLDPKNWIPINFILYNVLNSF